MEDDRQVVLAVSSAQIFDPLAERFTKQGDWMEKSWRNRDPNAVA
jgi:hypothetical protein